MSQDVRPGRFRRRLTIVFVLIAGLSSATIGLGSYLLVRDTRHDDFLERSLIDARLNHLTLTEQDNLTPSHLGSLLLRMQRRSADAAITVGADGDFVREEGLSIEAIPGSLLRGGDQDGDSLEHAETVVVDERFLVVAAPPTSTGVRLFLFYSQSGLLAGLDQLASILWRLWFVVVITAGLIGRFLARRTLQPVARASRAARSIAEGLLDTRLPVDSEDEFGAWALSFNEMAEALEAKVEELLEAAERERRFTSDVSHELRTPLSALVTSASMLEARMGELDADTAWITERTVREVRRLRGLVHELLEISRLQSGRETVTLTEVNIGRTLSQIIRNQGWEDRISYETKDVTVSTEKSRLERILVNLIHNALEHGGKGVQIGMETQAETVRVWVRDEGPGIEPEDMERIFDRFYKVEPSRPGGSGLGLAIAAEHARLLGAKIEVTSSPGEGTKFSLVIPRKLEPESAPVSATSDREQDPTSGALVHPQPF